jgi:hypothetical protein
MSMFNKEPTMMRIRPLALALPLLMAAALASQSPSGFLKAEGPYLGQKPPGTTGALFAPGFISTGLDEAILAMSPDGTECFWSIAFSGVETIATSRLENGRWTDPEVASFSGQYFDGWPAFRPDGKRLFFHSGRPIPDRGRGKRAEVNIWYVDRTNSGWGDPRPVGAPVNGAENACCPSVTKDGALYVSKKFGDASEKICRSALVEGKYQALEVLPATVNAAKENFHAYVSPDETFLIMPLFGLKDAIGGRSNYYVSFRDRERGWSELINLGPGINSARCGGMASISADGKYIFFQALTQPEYRWARDRRSSYRDLADKETRYPNGNTFDIYWIEAGIIEGLRPKS